MRFSPLCDEQSAPAQCFGVSGWSGAGTTPSQKNDPVALKDNLMPYALVGHVHEREVTHQLGQEVEFMPAVAPHFRGISMTVNVHLSRPHTLEQVQQHFRDHYAGEPLVAVQDAVPWVSRIAGQHGVRIGGFTLSADGRRLVVVSVLDNLLKGAATQALQNLNLAFGQPETLGIPLPQED
jgi:N-acetyl-gamma-glutamyl-phosphate reductase